MKLYLIACYDKQDCIEMFKHMYLNLKADFSVRTLYEADQNNLIISSHKAEIRFLTADELWYVDSSLGKSLCGMRKSPKYYEFINYQLKEAYEWHFRLMHSVQHKNDRENFLGKYFDKGVLRGEVKGMSKC